MPVFRSGAAAMVPKLLEQLERLRADVRDLQQAQRAERTQFQLQLTRLARAVERLGLAEEQDPPLASRAIPLEPPTPAPLAWQAISAAHPDPGGVQWLHLDACPLCGGRERTVVNPWNKLLLLADAPDDSSARYDYAICHACGVLSASRRPIGARYRFMLEHFGEVTAKQGGRDIANPLLNPYPLTEDDRAELRRLIASGVFVSDHSADRRRQLAGVWRDRFDNSGHVDVLGALLQPRGARVLEVRVKSGAILDGLRRQWGAEVYAMPIWESQQFIVRELYGIPASDLIDFERFAIPFDGPFDIIVCQHMLTHALHPAAFLAEVRRKLAPGGHIYLHNEPDDAEFLLKNQSMIATLNPLHMQAFDQPSLVRAIAANGFETVFCKSHDLSHLCLARRSDDAAMTPMTSKQASRRIERYQMAHDRAILRIDEAQRGRVADQWDEVVRRAVASGVAEFDDRNRLRLVAH
jgi:SAM-dependent methyltransferase